MTNLNPTIDDILAAAMQRRAEQGLKLEWFIPSENRIFTAFPKNEAQKRAWIAKAQANGWTLV